MDGFTIERDVIEGMARQLAENDYGHEGTIEKELCINGALLYAMNLEDRGLAINRLLAEADLDDQACPRKVHAVITCAAYEQFLADLDWAWEHFDARIGLDSVEGCKEFVATQEAS